MNEQTMIWFLQKAQKHRLSKEAMVLWMDLYAYLQNQNRACCPRIKIQQLSSVCEMEQELLKNGLQELECAKMLKVQYKQGAIYCMLIAEPLSKALHRTAG